MTALEERWWRSWRFLGLDIVSQLYDLLWLNVDYMPQLRCIIQESLTKYFGSMIKNPLRKRIMTAETIQRIYLDNMIDFRFLSEWIGRVFIVDKQDRAAEAAWLCIITEATKIALSSEYPNWIYEKMFTIDKLLKKEKQVTDKIGRAHV